MELFLRKKVPGRTCQSASLYDQVRLKDTRILGWPLSWYFLLSKCSLIRLIPEQNSKKLKRKFCYFTVFEFKNWRYFWIQNIKVHSGFSFKISRSRAESFRSFFGRIENMWFCFLDLLTFSIYHHLLDPSSLKVTLLESL